MPDKVNQGELLAQLANEIGTAGEEHDDAMTALLKGVKDGLLEISGGLTSLTALIKAKGGDGDEGMGGDDDEGDGDEGDDDEGDEGDDSAGYDRMDKGQGGDEFVDATQFVLQTEARLRNVEAMLKASRKREQRLEKLVIASMEHNARMQAGLGQAMAPLAKAVMTTNERLLSLPAAPGRRLPQRAAERHGIDGGKGGQTIPMQTLAKALQEKIISEEQLRSYRLSGQFVPDKTAHEATAVKVRAL